MSYDEFIEKLTKEVREISEKTFKDYNAVVLGNPEYNDEDVQDYFEYLPKLNISKRTQIYYDSFVWSGEVEVNPKLEKAENVNHAWDNMKKDIFNSIDDRVEWVCADMEDDQATDEMIDECIERIGIEREAFF